MISYDSAAMCDEARRVVISVVDEQSYRPTLIQVVPRRTTEPDGVADCALALARAWRTSSGTNTVFLSATPRSQSAPLEDAWRTVCVPERKAQALCETIERLSAESQADGVALHFSGYGYQKRGVPIWLVEGLRMWRRKASVPLVTVFHELYATGRPWRSAFWVSPLQKQIARKILHLSSAAIAPTDAYKRLLLDWQRGDAAKITAMPVFSNVGEPGCGSVPHARTATAVVFGLAGVEEQLFGAYRSQVERIVSVFGITKIIDIGLRLSSLPSSLAGVPVISSGVLPASAVSELLQSARFGLIAYPLDFIGKSGVFAAYAAHGVVPIVLSNKEGVFDGLHSGQHFLDGLRLGTDARDEDLTLIQDKLFTWYSCHSVTIHADLIMHAISGAGSRRKSLATA